MSDTITLYTSNTSEVFEMSDTITLYTSNTSEVKSLR